MIALVGHETTQRHGDSFYRYSLLMQGQSPTCHRNSVRLENNLAIKPPSSVDNDSRTTKSMALGWASPELAEQHDVEA